MIQLTDTAQQEIDRLRRRQNQPNAVCRLSLQPSSCAQWAYTLSLEATAAQQDDVYEFDGLQLVVRRDDETSTENIADYIKDLKIDFAEDLTGGAFRFDNPLATESCRCGHAFAV
ncbi:MAG: iron-sulfur cluster assembly accessory protein [Phormidesmis sp.]